MNLFIYLFNILLVIHTEHVIHSTQLRKKKTNFTRLITPPIFNKNRAKTFKNYSFYKLIYILPNHQPEQDYRDSLNIWFVVVTEEEEKRNEATRLEKMRSRRMGWVKHKWIMENWNLEIRQLGFKLWADALGIWRYGNWASSCGLRLGTRGLINISLSLLY